MRTQGRLKPSKELLDLLRTVEAYAVHASGFVFREDPRIPVSVIERAESKLETHLPDDYWIIASLEVEEFAGVGIASLPPHGDPAPFESILNALLVLEDDSRDVWPEGLLLPIAEWKPMTRSRSDGYLAVRKGVSFEERNSQRVFGVGMEHIDPRPLATWLSDALQFPEEITPVERSTWPMLEIEGEQPSARATGPLVTSATFDSVMCQLAGMAAHARANGHSSATWAPEFGGALFLEEVVRTEASLSTALPDDFWALVAFGVAGLAYEGLTPSAHSEFGPAHGGQVEREILRHSKETRTKVSDELLSIGLVADTSRGLVGGKKLHICIPRGRDHNFRNEPVVLFDGKERLESLPFAQLVLRFLRNTNRWAQPAAATSLPVARLIAHEQIDRTAKPSRGSRVQHKKFGPGVVHGVLGDGAELKLEVDFDDGRRVLLARFVSVVS